MRATSFTLNPPLRVAWHARTGILIESISAHDDVAVVSGKGVLIGIDLATGNERWRRSVRTGLGPMPATRRGFVVLDNEKGVSHLHAFDWAGNPRWSLRRDWFFPGDGIHAESDAILCAGQYNESGAAICAYIDDATGKVDAEYPCVGVQPRAIEGGFLYRGDAAGEFAGLFRVAHAGGEIKRLVSVPVQNYEIAGDIAVVNAGEDMTTELMAVDVASGNVRWRAPGGAVCEIAIDGDDVVSGVVEDETISVVSRSLRDGVQQWAGPFVPGLMLKPLLTPTLVVAYGADDHIALHDRKSGRLVQRLESVATNAGAVVTRSGLVEVRMRDEIVCWRGA